MVAERAPDARLGLRAAIAGDPDLAVIAVARSGTEAIACCRELRPDLVTIDLHVPGLDGLEFTRTLMAERPTPIIIVTSDANARSMDALRAGALALVRRPAAADGHGDGGAELRAMIHALADVKLVRRAPHGRDEATASRAATGPARYEIIALAASAGGPGALARLLTDLPSDPTVPLVAVQHNTRGFMPELAAWLSRASGKPVVLAGDGEVLRPGTLHLAPDDVHLGVDAGMRARFGRGQPVGGFRPSATYLFESIAQSFGARALAVILTGMGSDGAAGLAQMHERGATVLAQDEESSLVFGMPGAAVAAGVCDEVLPLSALAARIAALVGFR